MKKIVLVLALIISTIGLNAQNIGSYKVVAHDGYELQYTVTKTSPAECAVALLSLTSQDGIEIISIPETMEIEGTEFSVTTIPNEGFAYCYSAMKFELPKTITYIGNKAFYYCNLATEIAIPENVTFIGNEAFYSCPVTEMTIPNGVTTINHGVFNRCTELTKVVIPNSVTSIGKMVFKECFSLTEIELPESITDIDDYTFSNCKRLELIICKATTPPVCKKTFYNIPENVIVRVPAESVELYKAAEQWNQLDIRAIGTESIDENVSSSGIYPNPATNCLFIETNENIIEACIFSVTGAMLENVTPNDNTIDVSNLNSGIYFVKVRTENGEMVKRFVKE